MKRLIVKENQTNFIGAWNIENDELCKNIIFSMRKVTSKNMFRFCFGNFRDFTKDFLVFY